MPPSHFLIIHLNVILPSTPGSSRVSPPKPCMHLSSPPRACYILCPYGYTIDKRYPWRNVISLDKSYFRVRNFRTRLSLKIPLLIVWTMLGSLLVFIVTAWRVARVHCYIPAHVLWHVAQLDLPGNEPTSRPLRMSIYNPSCSIHEATFAPCCSGAPFIGPFNFLPVCPMLLLHWLPYRQKCYVCWRLLVTRKLLSLVLRRIVKGERIYNEVVCFFMYCNIEYLHFRTNAVICTYIFQD
jgi:hypothetical protein